MARPIVVMITFLLIFAMTAFGQTHVALGQSETNQPPAAEVTPDRWPRTVDIKGAKYTVYQPQLDSWDYSTLQAHAAVSVLPAGAKAPTFGVIDFTAKTVVHKASRTVDFHDVRVTKATFPAAPDKDAQYQQGFESMTSGGPSTMSLDRLQAMLAIEGAQKHARQMPVKNSPPKFVFSQTAAVLVIIDGEPVWRPVKDTSLERVINTRPLVLLDDSSGTFYIHLFDGFIAAQALTGPWKAADNVPSSVSSTAQKLAEAGTVDLMEGPSEGSQKPSLKNGVPTIVVATAPTELIVTDGPPDWESIEGTNLLYVNNTTADVFEDMENEATYILDTGRWFSAPSFSGPWKYVPAGDLPADFAQIPDNSPKENVKASVPGTPQAQEAIIANEIPQMATVERSKATFTPQVDGAPDLKPVPDTSLMYVFNSPTPIIKVSQYEWCAVLNGVWFTASSLQGPWVVATSVPAVIYSIPPSSPVYYVTYVKIYNVTPTTVVVGYTPGYMGTVVSSDGVVVYGTGYTYVPYIGATVWYPPPITYGYAANVTWTPYTGWAVGFGFGWGFGAAVIGSSCCWGYCAAPYWGPMPYAPYHGYAYGPYKGAVAWGPAGWAATSGDVYHRWGPTTAVTRTSGGYNAWTGTGWSNKVGVSYNSMTGRASAGQRAAVSNVYTGNYAYGRRGATYNPQTGVSAKGGEVHYGNVYEGTAGTAKYGQVTGPGGQTAGAARVNNNYYADRNGNLYRNTGSGWQTYGNGSWNSVQDQDRTNWLQSQQQAREAGAQRSAASSWGSENWGGGFRNGEAGGAAGAGGWDRGAGFGGGGRSWGGGGFGGGFRGGGRR